MSIRLQRDTDMNCKSCGKPNYNQSCVIFGDPTPETPFSLCGGKGMICLECFTAKQTPVVDYMKRAEDSLDKWKNPRSAFELAIKQGRLSRDPHAANYAGHYMYMGPTTDLQADAFKHTITREYLPVTGDQTHG